MFSGTMPDAWIVGTMVAVVGGAIGFFVVLRGAAFAAHAIPSGSFAGAAGATLVGVSTLLGLGLFAVLGAFGIAGLSHRGRRDVGTALALVLLLGLGALFVSLSAEPASSIFALLFGEVLAVGRGELLPTAALTAVCLAALATLWRPLLLASALPEAVVGARAVTLDLAFLLLVALATTMTVPVVGTTLIFSVLVAPAATARSLAGTPGRALSLSVITALAIVWSATALAYLTEWPIGFFVGSLGAAAFLAARLGTSPARAGGSRRGSRSSAAQS